MNQGDWFDNLESIPQPKTKLWKRIYLRYLHWKFRMKEKIVWKLLEDDDLRPEIYHRLYDMTEAELTEESWDEKIYCHECGNLVHPDHILSEMESTIHIVREEE